MAFPTSHLDMYMPSPEEFIPISYEPVPTTLGQFQYSAGHPSTLADPYGYYNAWSQPLPYPNRGQLDYPYFLYANAPASESDRQNHNPSLPRGQLYSPRSRGKKSPKPIQIPHPYARLVAKKDEAKRRKIWNHALEKSLFSPYELSTVGAPQRRVIYISSLEAHVDRLHSHLLSLSFWPVPFTELDPYKGLNSKTAKSMVSGLQHDASISKLKLLELERANSELTNVLSRTDNRESPYHKIC